MPLSKKYYKFIPWLIFSVDSRVEPPVLAIEPIVAIADKHRFTQKITMKYFVFGRTHSHESAKFICPN